MENKQLQEIKKEYKKRLKDKKEMLRLLSTTSVIKYLNIMGYDEKDEPLLPFFTLDEKIMEQILSNYDIVSSKNIYLNMGLYLITDEDSIFMEERLIKESDREIIKKMREYDLFHSDKTCLVGSSIEYISYDLESGKIKHDEDKAPIFITLPYLQEIIDNLKDSDNVNSSTLRYSLNIRNQIARNQFFIRLVYNNYKDVLSYYENPSNWQEIDNDINDYLNINTSTIYKNYLDIISDNNRFFNSKDKKEKIDKCLKLISDVDAEKRLIKK